MRSFEVEGLEKKGKDFILDIAILPNRAHDLLSHLGVAREVAVILNLKLKIKDSPPKADQPRAEKLSNNLKIEIQDKKLCNRYIGRIIEGVKVGPSPKWLKERLEIIGQKSINNIVDAINYVMFEFGQPLHAFDYDKLKTENLRLKTMIVRRAKRGEQIITLDNQEIKLDENILVIADDYEPLAIAGVKGGKKVEVDSKTKNIILESANFESVNIRKTSKKIGIRTESSLRFENGISPYLAELAMNRVAGLILDIAGGKCGQSVDKYVKKVIPVKIKMDLGDFEKLLGIKIPEKEILGILKRLRFIVKKSQGNLIVSTPLERLDVLYKEDVIEEVARIYGYDKIPAVIPEGAIFPPKRNEELMHNSFIKEVLVGAGLSEVYNYSFSDSGEFELQNPISEEKKFLRIDLANGLIANINDNLRFFDEVRIFEIGNVFLKEEKKHLACAFGFKDKKAGKTSFFEAKGVLEFLFTRLGIQGVSFENIKDSVENAAEILVNSVALGIIREIKPSIAVLEIDLEKLSGLANGNIIYKPLQKYPAVLRDLALLVPKNTRVLDVFHAIQNSGGKLLMSLDLFDVYEGKELGERKSFAYHLLFQSAERTLLDSEVNNAMENIKKALSESGWVIR